MIEVKNLYKSFEEKEVLKGISTVFEDGIQYYIAEPSEGYTAVIWYQDGYVMVVSGTVDKNEALDLCRSVKIKEE